MLPASTIFRVERLSRTRRKTGKTTQEADEKRKKLDKKVENGGDENIKIRTNQILP